MRKNLQRAAAFVLISAMLGQAVPMVAAVDINLNSVCCTKRYPVYGDEQPQQVGRDGCIVRVDLEVPELEVPPIPESTRPSDEPTTALGRVGDFFATGGKNIVKSVTTSFPSAFESVASPLVTIFQQRPIKKILSDTYTFFFQRHTVNYHAFLDEDIFGKAIEKVSEFQNSEELNNYLNGKNGACDASNPQPNCVVEQALCSYEKYAGVLFHQTGQNLGNQATASNIEGVLAALQQRDQALLEEMMHSQEALDTAMAVYSQFFQTYRLHLRFKEIITALVKVRNMTSYMRALVGCVPNKFVGVATTKCN